MIPIFFRALALARMAPLLAMCAGAIAAPAYGQSLFYQVYENGIKAFEAGDLALAERQMKRALELDSRQSRQKRFYGMTFRPYFPEYYLALIAADRGQYQTTLDYIARLERAGLIKQGDKEYQGLSVARQVAERAVQTQPATAARATTQTAPSESAPTPAATAAEPPTTASIQGPPPSPAPTPSAPQSASRVDASADPPNSVGIQPSPEVTRPAPPLEPRNDIAALLRARDYAAAWSLASSDRSANRTQSTAQVKDAALREVRRLISSDELRQAHQLVSLLLTLAPADRDVATIAGDVADQIEGREVERQALIHLLRGEYEDTLRVSSTLLRQQRASARLRFYVACGLAGQTLLGGANSTADAGRRARDMYMAIPRSARTFEKEERYLSPRLLALLRDTP